MSCVNPREFAHKTIDAGESRIWEQAVPTDPCIYRLAEIDGVCGPTVKAPIHEKFGDGIMSAVDFDMSVTRAGNPKGDQVKLEISSKYLACSAW